MPELLRSYSRRKFLSTSAATVSVAATGALGLRAWDDSAKPAAASERQSIRPFRVNIPERDLTDLRRRIMATRWPDRETVNDQSQGVQLATMKELTQYWGTKYNWRNIEETLQLPAAVHNRDRRTGHTFHPRPLPPRERPADHPDPRLARLHPGVPEGHRTAQRPHGPRRPRRGRLPPRHPVDARLRLLGAADDHRVEPRPHRAPGRY